MLGLSTAAARSDLWRCIEVRVLPEQQQQQQLYSATPKMYVQRFGFAGRIECKWLESSINSAECGEFDNKNRPIASEDIIYMWSYLLGLSTASRSDLWRLIEIRGLLQQKYSSSEVF